MNEDKQTRRVISTVEYKPEGKCGLSDEGSDKWLHPEIDDEEYDRSFIRAVKTHNNTQKSLIYVLDLFKSKFTLNPDVSYTKEELKQALTDWVEFDNASAMKDYSKNKSISNFVGASGWTPSKEEQQKLKRQALIIQKEAIQSNSEYNLLYRGFTLPNMKQFDKIFKIGKLFRILSLTATSTDIEVSRNYANPDYIGLGDGKGVRVILHLENPKGIIGVVRDKVEIVLPKGLVFKVTNTWKDDQGYYHVTLYSEEQINLIKHLLHKERLIQKEVPVHHADGKITTRKQWVDPHTGQPVAAQSTESAPPNKGKQTIMVTDPDHFDKHIKKKYTQQHLMNQARKQGIKWDEKEHPAMNWMRAAMAIKGHIKGGNIFHVEHDEKDVDKNMESKGKDKAEKFLLELLEKHGSRENLMQWAEEHDISWKKDSAPEINWMRAAMAIKRRIAQGKMVDGVRTKQKELMKEANTVITQDVKDYVKDLGKEHPRDKVLQKAKEHGIMWDEKEHPAMNWMRGASAIQKFIAQGGKFSMIGEISTNQDQNKSSVGGVKLSKYQQLANDTFTRVSKENEQKTKVWGLRAILADNPGISSEDAQNKYQQFVDSANKSKLMIHFDPDHLIKKDTTMLDQISSEGRFKNNYELGIGDNEEREYYERQLFGQEYDDAESRERPIYGCLDLFNKGLDANPSGSIALILKDNVKDRTTCLHTDSYNLEHDTEGKLTRHANYAHQVITNNWRTKWKNPKGTDKLRQRAFDSVINGTRNNDSAFFEAQVHGGIDLHKDVDHILIPHDWQQPGYKDLHNKIDRFSKLIGASIKYHQGVK